MTTKWESIATIEKMVLHAHEDGRNGRELPAYVQQQIVAVIERLLEGKQ